MARNSAQFDGFSPHLVDAQIDPPVDALSSNDHRYVFSPASGYGRKEALSEIGNSAEAEGLEDDRLRRGVYYMVKVAGPKSGKKSQKKNRGFKG